MPDLLPLLSLLALLFHVGGALSSIHVLMSGRTPQGAIAWIGFLVTIPYLGVPLYWIFGPRRYNGYVDSRFARPTPFDPVVDELREKGDEFISEASEDRPGLVALERLVKLPFTTDNEVELLVDGEATFTRILEAVESAERYLLLQFFIVRADRIGTALGEALKAACARGVDVCFLYDEIGSRALPKAYIADLCASGVRICAFETTRRAHRFQLNFRNHRKLVVADGVRALLGGINVGDEYLGRDPELSPWRDTFIEVRGPSVQALQLAFLEDWHWATDEIPRWDWTPRAAETSSPERALVLPTGPADEFETCSLLFVALFDEARERLWISTPYFVFDNQVLTALQLAALRGVDVRVLLPEQSDYAMAYYAGWSYHSEVLAAGVRIFRYREGFMHQKAVLVDDDVALIGTMNLDNRAMRLNFELGLLVESRAFAGEVEAMLERDFAASNEVHESDLERRDFLFRLKARAARLFAPIL